ncbi:glycoside hydrolase family 43 protein [Enterococcus sp. LJL120]
MKPSQKFSSLLLATLLLAGCADNQQVTQTLEDPEFENVSVHDPSIIKDQDEFYIVGSHAQFAKSTDLMHWEQVSNSVAEDSLFENVRQELADEFAYSKTDTMWASDIFEAKNGKFYLYYCLCQGTSPLAVLGVAESENVDGPYKKVESFLYSGSSPQFGETYDATINPNVIDPQAFYDNDGKMWMVYGSYSGGIFILEMDDQTGLPVDRDSYGTHLIGGNHSRIEAPYIQYNEQNGYYYLFTSFGGLDSYGGYNIRVARSKNPDGPYEDSQGNLMSEVKGAEGSSFDDTSIQDYGVKLIGNFLYEEDDGLTNAGYISPGHNSSYYDATQDQYYLIFHTRFPNSGELHEVRVHQYYFTENGWPIMSPLRFADESLADYSKKQVTGSYSLITFTKDISDWLNNPQTIELTSKQTITGDVTGEWTLSEDNLNQDSSVILNGKKYNGKFISNWDENQGQQVITFSGMADDGIPVFLVGRGE